MCSHMGPKATTPYPDDEITLAKSPRVQRQREELQRLKDLLRATLVFYSPGAWNAERGRLWTQLTGTSEPTTKSLCDAIRKTGITP